MWVLDVVGGMRDVRYKEEEVAQTVAWWYIHSIRFYRAGFLDIVGQTWGLLMTERWLYILLDEDTALSMGCDF